MYFSWYLAHFKTKYNIYKQPKTMMRHTQLQQKEKSKEIAVSPITAPNSQKVYVELQNVTPAMSSESDSPNSSLHPVHRSSALIAHFHHHLIPAVTLLIQVQL